ncbi:MAG: hypothetical protein JW829_12130 [Pirellulales bacterium]|nr:hypothetical protein [Pirellulales bacterium]
MPFELIHGTVGIVFLAIWAYIGRIVWNDQCHHCQIQRRATIANPYAFTQRR